MGEGRGEERSRPGMKSAFTLAEVLITLVIIGVIAAITVPTLITKYQKEQTVTRLKKAYSALSQTTNRAIADYGPINTWEYTDSKDFVNKFIVPYMSVMKPAQTQNEGNWYNKFNYLNNIEATFGGSKVRIYLNDGSSITGGIQGYSSVNPSLYRGAFYIDINGDKKPNKVGKDMFLFFYYLTDSHYGGKIIPEGYASLRERIMGGSSDWTCNKNKRGTFCAALIIKDGWQIKDDYPW